MSLLSLLLIIIQPSDYRIFIFLAMVMSSVGDICLMKANTFKRFMTGAIFFMVGHLLYGFAYFKASATYGVWYVGSGVYIGAVLIVLILTALLYFAFLKKAPFSLLALCLVYLLIASVNILIIFNYGFNLGGIKYLCALGVFSFAASDFVIALEQLKIIESSKTTKSIIWWLYPIGQILIISFI